MQFQVEALVIAQTITCMGSCYKVWQKPHAIVIVFFEIYQISTCDILRLMYISNGKHPVIRRYVLFQVQRYGMLLENQIRP